jgi:hypothetical protein
MDENHPYSIMDVHGWNLSIMMLAMVNVNVHDNYLEYHVLFSKLELKLNNNNFKN